VERVTDEESLALTGWLRERGKEASARRYTYRFAGLGGRTMPRTTRQPSYRLHKARKSRPPLER